MVRNAYLPFRHTRDHGYFYKKNNNAGALASLLCSSLPALLLCLINFPQSLLISKIESKECPVLFSKERVYSELKLIVRSSSQAFACQRTTKSSLPVDFKITFLWTLSILTIGSPIKEGLANDVHKLVCISSPFYNVLGNLSIFSKCSKAFKREKTTPPLKKSKD